MHTTWALRGCTPVIRSSGSWKKLTLSGILITTPEGKRVRLLLRSVAGNMDAAETLRFLKDVKRHLHGRKLLLFWDGLPAHRARVVQAWLHENRSWLRVERFPAYAPELNPIEYLWGALKRRYLGNLADLSEIGTALRRCRRRLSDVVLLRGFLRASGLYD